MASSSSPRGEHLLRADRGFSTGSSWFMQLFAPGFHKLLDRIHAGLATGKLEAKLPDGRTRLLGNHAPGAAAEIEIKSWRSLIRLMTSGSVGWYCAWAEGEWDSPAPETLFELFVANRRSLGNVARAKERSGSVTFSLMRSVATIGLMRAAISQRITISAMISMPPGSTRR